MNRTDPPTSDPPTSDRPTSGWLAGDWPVRRFWLLPAAVVLLRSLPYLWSRLVPADEGETLLRVGYIPPDFLSYLAFIRQASEQSTVLLHDPYTTADQGQRFVLLLHWLLGQIAWLTGWAPDVVLELSRIPLTFAFFGVLWWFLRPILPSSRDRYWACLLVGLSGGIEGLFKPLSGLLPEFIQERFMAGVWHLYGWNTFEALYNPLWIAGLTLTLIVIRPAIDPHGPRSIKEVLQLGAAFLMLYFVHPYSALAALAIVGAVPLGEWIFRRRVARRRLVGLVGGMAPALFVAALVSRWQAQDPVYQAASQNVLGTLNLQVFWYPVTLGALGLLALWGAQRWIREAHPYGVSLMCWIAAIMFMHTSPVFNGYHFVCYLHLPICILAAPVLRRIVEQLPDARPAWRLSAAALVFLTFVSFLLVTAESVGDVRRRNGVPQSYFEVVAALARRPNGNTLAPPELGNVIPAYTSHRVWVGHWFLTPDYHVKAARYEQLVQDPRQAAQLVELIDAQRIRYLVVPCQEGERLEGLLKPRLERRLRHGELEILVLRTDVRDRRPRRAIVQSGPPRREMNH